MLRIFLIVLISSLISLAANADPVPLNEKEVSQSFREFPRAFWYASDAWIKSINNTGSIGDPLTSTAKGKLINFTLVNTGSQPKVKFTLDEKSEEENEGRIIDFVFVYIKDEWRGVQCLIRDGKENTNLYEDSFMAPSMQRFVDAEVRKLMRQEGIYSPHPQMARIVPPAYTALIGEGLSGSGFHFSFEGKRFAAATMHQFDFKTPGELSSNDLSAKVSNLRRVHRQIDVQVMTYHSEWLDAKVPLVYDRDHPPMEVGSPVFILNHGQWMAAHVLTTSIAGLKLAAGKPFPAAGLSGSPIIDGNTGRVVAVLTGADSPSAAKIIDCEVLQLPTRILDAPDPDQVPQGIFGIPAREIPSLELAKLVQSNLIHPGAFSAKLGMTPEELLKARPNITKVPRQESVGYSTSEAFDPEYLFSQGNYRQTAQKVPGSELEKSRRVSFIELASGRNPTVQEMADLARFAQCYLGEPSMVREWDSKKGKPGTQLLFVVWSLKNLNAGLSFFCEDPRGKIHTKLFVVAGQFEPGNLLGIADTVPAPLDPGKIGERVERWGKALLTPALKLNDQKSDSSGPAPGASPTSPLAAPVAVSLSCEAVKNSPTEKGTFRYFLRFANNSDEKLDGTIVITTQNSLGSVSAGTTLLFYPRAKSSQTAFFNHPMGPPVQDGDAGLIKLKWTYTEKSGRTTSGECPVPNRIGGQ